MASTTFASPGAPPPSLILYTVEPGPIGSVERSGVASWPGSMQMSGVAAAGLGNANAAATKSPATNFIGPSLTVRAGGTYAAAAIVRVTLQSFQHRQTTGEKWEQRS